MSYTPMMPQGSLRLPSKIWYVPENYFDHFDALRYLTAGITKAEFMACKVYQDYALSLKVARDEHLVGIMTRIHEGLVTTTKYKARLAKAGELSLAREKVLAEKKAEVEVMVQASEVCGVVFEEKKVLDEEVLVVSGVGDLVCHDGRDEVSNKEVVAFPESDVNDGCVKRFSGDKDEVPVDVDDLVCLDGKDENSEYIGDSLSSDEKGEILNEEVAFSESGAIDLCVEGFCGGKDEVSVDVDNPVCLDGKEVAYKYVGDLPSPDENGEVLNEEVLVVSESSAIDGDAEVFLDEKDGVRVEAESVVCLVGKDGVFNDGRDKNLSEHQEFLFEEQIDESFEKKLDSICDEVDVMARNDKPMIVWNVVNFIKRSLKVLDVFDNYEKAYGVFEPQVIYGGDENNYYFNDDYDGYGLGCYDGKEV